MREIVARDLSKSVDLANYERWFSVMDEVGCRADRWPAQWPRLPIGAIPSVDLNVCSEHVARQQMRAGGMLTAWEADDVPPANCGFPEVVRVCTRRWGEFLPDRAYAPRATGPQSLVCYESTLGSRLTMSDALDTRSWRMSRFFTQQRDSRAVLRVIV